MTVNVLLTGAGGNLSHFIFNALKMTSLNVRIVACDCSSNAVGLYLAAVGYVVPLAKDTSYVARIIEICRAEKIDIIMVGGIAEMRILSLQKEYIKEHSGAFVVGSSPEALHRMEDKWELSQALRLAGFEYPRSVLPNNKQVLKRFLDEHTFPFIVKDRMGAGGSTGVGIARDIKQLNYLIETIPNPVIQEYLFPDDQEYTVGAFIGRDGKGKGSIVMKRQLQLGMTFKGQVLPESPLGEYGESILAKLGCEGPANLQLRLTKRGPVVFEINPRFSSTTSARAYYGYNEPEMCIRSFVLGEEFKRPKIIEGRFFRVIDDIFVSEHDFEETQSKGIFSNPHKRVEKENEIQRLEAISDFYAQGDYMDELLVDREAELIRHFTINNSHALEVGCGNGYSTQQLFRLFEKYEVLEPSSKNIKLMKDRQGLKNIIFHNMLLEEFSSDQHFENIIFLNVIEHVEDPVALLSILKGILTNEGRIYISAPNCMSLNRRAGYKMGLLKDYRTMAPKDYVLGHRRLYTVEMMRDHCAAAGLKIIEIRGVYLKPLSERQMVDLGDAVVKAFYSIGEDIPEYCANIFAVVGKNYN